MCLAFSENGRDWQQIAPKQPLPMIGRAADTWPCLYHDDPAHPDRYDIMLRNDFSVDDSGGWRRIRGTRVVRGDINFGEFAETVSRITSSRTQRDGTKLAMLYWKAMKYLIVAYV